MIQKSDNSLKRNATTFAILIRNLEYNVPTVLILRLNSKDFTTVGYVALTTFSCVHNEYEAVFRLSDGKLYKDGNKKWSTSMISEIEEWYKDNRDELIEAWENLHGL